MFALIVSILAVAKTLEFFCGSKSILIENEALNIVVKLHIRKKTPGQRIPFSVPGVQFLNSFAEAKTN